MLIEFKIIIQQKYEPSSYTTRSVADFGVSEEVVAICSISKYKTVNFLIFFESVPWPRGWEFSTSSSCLDSAYDAFMREKDLILVQVDS